MKKLLIALLCLYALSSVAFGQSDQPRIRHGETDAPGWSPAVQWNWSKNWSNPHAVYFFNGYGDTLNVGDVVLFKAMVLVDSLARASAADTITIADSLDTFHWWQIRAKSLNATTACTLYISGLDTADAAQTDSFVLSTSEDGVVYSSKLWRKIDLGIVRNAVANDSFVIYGVPYFTVYAAAAAANVKVAGVVAAKSNPDTYVKVYVEGLCQAKLLGATTEVVSGGYLETSGTALYGQYNATPAAGKRLGRAVESGVTNKLYWIWLNP